MRRFTEAYFLARDLDQIELQTSLAYWDLCAVLPFGNTLGVMSKDLARREETRRRPRGFIDRAGEAPRLA